MGVDRVAGVGKARGRYVEGFLALALFFSLAGVTACVTPGPNIAIPIPPEQLAMKTEIGQSYVNRELRDEVLANLEKASKKLMETRIACIPDEIWEIDDNRAAVNKNFFGAKNVESEIRSCFAFARELSEGLETNYARFQDFRRKIAKVPHDILLLRIGVMQGVAAMFYGRNLLSYIDAIEKKNCSLEPLRRFTKGAKGLMSNLVDGQMPAMVKQLRNSLPEGDMATLELEIAVLAGKPMGEFCTKQLQALSGKNDPHETSILTWCGYAAFIRGDMEKAQQLWTQAGQSVHDPDAASYALYMLRGMEDGMEAAAVAIELDED